MTTFTMAMFGACYKKLAAFLHNMPCVFSLCMFVEPERQYVVLRGKVWFNGDFLFVDMGVEYGRQAAASLHLRRKAFANGEQVQVDL